MKQFLTVLGFELNNYFKTKGYVITTFLISAIMIIVLSIPSFIDCSKLIPALGRGGDVAAEDVDNKKEEEVENFAIVDNKNIIKDKSSLNLLFPNSNWQVLNNESEIEKLINNDEVEAGFVVNSITDYSYLVKNTDFTDMNQMTFNSILSNINKKDYAEKAGLNFEEIEAVYNTPIVSEVTILGKDSVSNYMYTYGLLFIIYMMILMYGQLIAMSVTAEKSNRAIEVLVTSTGSNSLIFGKVIAGAVASFIQVGTIMASGIIGYAVNKNAWNGLLDNVFNIPTNMLVAFALFGITGYLFYAFIFGALGALVSKTEDIGSSVGPITMIFVVVFFISMFGMTNSDSPLIKVASYIPFSSCMAMIVRVAMGTVSNIEIIISYVILVGSTVIVGLGGAKVYRLATLMYGNPIKLKNALKWFKKEKENQG